MNLHLERTRFSPEGIFGHLIDADSEEGSRLTLCTLEHAYPKGNAWVPKLADGTYRCLRGMHQLAHSLLPFETFEILDVPEFQGMPVWGLLFHRGNFETESAGCVLLGLSASDTAVLSSVIAFDRFMAAQIGVDEFQLTVASVS